MIDQLRSIARTTAENSNGRDFRIGNMTYGNLEHLLRDFAKKQGAGPQDYPYAKIAANALADAGIQHYN